MNPHCPMYFGTESEFAVLGSKSAREQFARELHALCSDRFPVLRSSPDRPDMYLPWGRLYMDAGLHPEWSTAEVTDPWSVVYFQKTGEEILSALAEAFSEDIVISRHNVDCLSQTTWGFHSSFQIMNPRLECYARVLIPHLVTRTLYTGSGGVDIDLDRQTCRFLISPRAFYYRSVFDCGSRSNRPLFHLKKEPLCSYYHRLHLICGENLFSNTANYLGIATTALLILLTENLGTMPICDNFSDDTLESVRRLSADPSLHVCYRTRDGSPIRPLDVQWRYLDFVYSKLDRGFMPPWARFTCHLWQQTLQNLEKGWIGGTHTLDWAAKLAQLEKQLNSWGQSFLGYSSCCHLSKEQLYELLELDLSFSKIGPEGRFCQLESRGVFEHHVQGVSEIRGGKNFEYPVMGRAAVRANAIERLSKKKRRLYLASWNKIIEANTRSYLNLDRVHCTEEKWTDGILDDEMSLLMKALQTKLQYSG